jgi:MFS family permease
MLPFLRARPTLFGALAVDAIGNGCAAPLLLLFFTRSAGLRLVTVGAVLSGANFVALVVPVLVSVAVARVGPLRVVVAAQILQGGAFFGFLFVHNAWQLGIAAFVAAVGLRMFWSTIFGLVDEAATDDNAFAEVGAVQAAGLGFGALLAGVLISAPGTGPLVAVVALDAASFAVSAVLLSRQPAGQVPVSTTPPVRTALADRRYLSLIVANVLFASCSILLFLGLPVLLYYHLRSQHWVIGAVLAASTVIVSIGQPWGVRHRRWSVPTALVAAGVLWCCWGIATALGSEHPGAVGVVIVCLAVILYSMAEALSAPACNTMAASYAPADQRASYLALFQYGFAFANVLVPVAFTTLDSASPALPWVAGAVAAAVGAAIVTVLGRLSPPETGCRGTTTGSVLLL